MSTTSTTIVRPPAPPGPVRWLKKNLFGTWYNAVLTVLAIAFLFLVLRGFLQWALSAANWAPITNSLKLLAVGQYPQDQAWRIGAIVLMISFLFGLSWRVWGGTVRTFALTLALVMGLIALLPIGISKMGLNIRLWFLANPVLTILGYQLGRTRVGKTQWVVVGWILFPLMAVPLLAGSEAILGLLRQDVGTIVLMISFMFGLSWRAWDGKAWTLALALAFLTGFLAFLFVGLDRIEQSLPFWHLLSPFLIFIGYQLGLTLEDKPQWVSLGWILLLVFTILVVLTIPLLLGFRDVTRPFLLTVDTIVSLFLVTSFLLGLSWRAAKNTTLGSVLTLASFVGFIVLLLIGLDKANLHIDFWLLVNPVLVFIGHQVGRTRIGEPRWAVSGWAFLIIFLAPLLFQIESVSWLPQVETNLWGGLLLTFLLALVGIVASFPIGVMLALGRQSSLPVVKAFCVMFIEMVRGVPLVTILFLSSIMLPLFLPEDVRIDRVLRAMIGMMFFAAAYMAENIRGGLQAIPEGQVEAAKAMGLNGFQTMAFIVLPQALRLVIPAIVGQFIALFMDTTLAVIVNLLELLGMGRSVLEMRAEWKLLNMEMFVFIAAIFWIFNYAMSYASRRLETALGVGER